MHRASTIGEGHNAGVLDQVQDSATISGSPHKQRASTVTLVHELRVQPVPAVGFREHQKPRMLLQKLSPRHDVKGHDASQPLYRGLDRIAGCVFHRRFGDQLDT